MTMKITQAETDASTELDTWELLLLWHLSRFEPGFPPGHLPIDLIAYKIDRYNAQLFLQKLLKKLKELKVLIPDIYDQQDNHFEIKQLDELSTVREKPETIKQEILDLGLFIDVFNSQEMIKELLREKVELYKAGKFWSSHHKGKNSFTYDFQKENFIKNVATYIKRYGSSLSLRESEDYKLFGEDLDRVNTVGTLLTLAQEDLITIEDIGLYDGFIYNRTDDNTDLFAEIKINQQLLSLLENDEEVEAAIRSEHKTYTCGDLTLDLSKAIIRYKDKVREISPTQIEIRLLTLLMRADRVFEYSEIAGRLELNSYQKGITNKDIARTIQYIRRDLAPILESVGMTKEGIENLILTKRNFGYKIRR
jgi:hypothetical protein